MLAYVQLWFSIDLPKLKGEETGSFSKNELRKLQRFYTQGDAGYGSVRNNLVTASTLEVSKVRQFLLSKPLYTNYTITTSNSKRMEAFARFKKSGIWRIDLLFVDKIAKTKNGVKFSLVR